MTNPPLLHYHLYCIRTPCTPITPKGGTGLRSSNGGKKMVSNPLPPVPLVPPKGVQGIMGGMGSNRGGSNAGSNMKPKGSGPRWVAKQSANKEVVNLPSDCALPIPLWGKASSLLCNVCNSVPPFSKRCIR